MAGRSVAVVFLFTFALSWVHAGKLPSYVKPCKKSDLEYDACLVRLVENMRPRLSNKGIPKLQVPPLEPFVLPGLEVVRDLDAIKVRALLQNIVAYGGKDFVINRLKTDVDKLAAEGTITLPFMQVKADYDVEGRILVAPFRGKGVFTGNFTGIKVDMKGDGKIIKKNGEDYIQINNIKLKIKVEDSNVKISQPNDQNGALAQSAIQFYNQNRKQLLEIIMPIVQETAEEVIGQIGNRILASVPMSELLPA